MSALTVVSLFAGVGGFDLAFERAGAKVVAAVEIDKSARMILERHFPDTALFPDVTKVTADELRAVGFVPERGVITAGFPCQDLSVAGRRQGLGGERSGLWWHVVRLLAELRPTWVVAENVPGLLSAVCPCPGDGTCIDIGRSNPNGCGEWRTVRKQRTWLANVPHTVDRGACPDGCMETHGGAMGAVLGSLAELGYGVAYRILDAQHFGVPQRRERVFIVGHLGTPFGAAAQVLLEPESSGGDITSSESSWTATASAIAVGAGDTGRDVAPAITARYGKGAVSDADDALLLGGIEHTHTQQVRCRTLQGGGKRGYRIDAEAAAGGHLIVERWWQR